MCLYQGGCCSQFAKSFVTSCPTTVLMIQQAVFSRQQRLQQWCASAITSIWHVLQSMEKSAEVIRLLLFDALDCSKHAMGDSDSVVVMVQVQCSLLILVCKTVSMQGLVFCCRYCC
jgi:hypothetical protein